jgi:uncharacterized protein (TIGR03437 family)
LFTLLLFSALSLFGQRAETIIYRATLLPSNEVPAIDINANGNATIRAHVVRNAQGEVISGTVDFIVSYTMPGAATFTGLHIHRGAAGANGPVVINTGIGGANGNIEDETGRGTISRPAQITPADTNPLTALRDMIANPAGFYVNLHTTVNPGGVIRGQLQVPETLTLLSVMSPRNEVPAIPGRDDARGLSAITAMRTFNEDGTLDSAQVLFETEYELGSQFTFTGFHIHAGPAGVNGPVVINTGLARTDSAAAGRGRLVYPVEVNVSQPNNVTVINNLFAFPEGFYVNLHTTEFGGGYIRGQLRRADENTFQMTLLPGNEVPALTIDASAPTSLKMYTARGADGNIVAGKVIFDVNHRFAGETRFTGLHIHDQVAGQNGPVTVNTGITGNDPVVSPTGHGNIYGVALVGDAAGLRALNSLAASPEKHYVNLHTTTNPGGAVRAQVASQFATEPEVTAATSGVGPAVANVAPGGLMAVYGTRFSHLSTDLATAWEGRSLPTSLNGTEVLVGGRPAPIVSILPYQVSVQVPVETETGPQRVVVRNAAGDSTAVATNVRTAAPAIFYREGDQGLLLNAITMQYVTEETPLGAGDLAAVITTGNGLTTPRLPTGALVPDTLPAPSGTATLGGRPAVVVTTLAVPGIPGVYAMVINVPSGLAAGMQPLEITMGEERSNRVMVPVR